MRACLFYNPGFDLHRIINEPLEHLILIRGGMVGGKRHDDDSTTTLCAVVQDIIIMV